MPPDVLEGLSIGGITVGGSLALFGLFVLFGGGSGGSERKTSFAAAKKQAQIRNNIDRANIINNIEENLKSIRNNNNSTGRNG